MKRIGDILTRSKIAVVVEDGTNYKQVTIRTNYKGVCLRGTQDGSTILTKNQFVVSAGQFILSRIDARNGAFGIIPDELEGAIVTNDFLAFDINEEKVEIEFFNVFLQSPVFLEACIKASRGNTNRKRVDEDFFLQYEVALPPREEQTLLIERIHRGRTAIGTVQHEITRQEALLAKLKQAILQEAIAGKLTANWRAAHPDVEPASQILQRIQAEKARLVAAKKIRPEKPLPKITLAEIPFEIPHGWEWCRLGNILNFSSGDGLTSAQMAGGDVPVFGGNGVNGFHNKANVEVETVVVGRVGANCGAVHMTPARAWVTDNAFITSFSEACLTKEFLVLLLRFLDLNHLSFDGSQPVISGKRVYPLPTPLPPIAEQAAIVARVEALMTTCSALEAEIEHARTHAAQLLQAVLKEAFAPAA
ncbi:MAG: restriction endonuclease subunit S [Xanthomonadales bacterium]|nr:restriction endonuclease subunit S [Xanthomonadales bacterium]